MSLDSDTADRSGVLSECEQQLGYKFAKPGLLKTALTHASGASNRLASNERLEFLGDAILGAVVCESLFQQFPSHLEGDLTKIKSVVVSRQVCAKVTAEMGLERFLVVGKGISSGKPVPKSIIADMYESVVAAIYLDGGFEPARDFILRTLAKEIEVAASGSADENFKSILQQLVQRDFNSTPTYELQAEKGPDHDKSFQVIARFADRVFAPAWGKNKKEAEQRAALNALAELRGEEVPYSPSEAPS